MMISKPPPRPTPISVHRQRPLHPEPCSPGEEGHLSKSLGDSVLLTGAMLPLYRQISEVSSITHSGYLFKRSNRPFQQVSPFPLDHLEISVGVQGDTIEAEIAPSLHPKPSSTEDPFFRDILQSNGDNHQTPPHRPLRLPDPVVASLSSRFQGTQDEQQPESIPLVPLLPASTDITGSISTKATDHEESEEPLLTEAVQKKQRQLALEESLNSPAAFFGINVESAFEPSTQPLQAVTPSTSNLGIEVIAPPPLATTNRNASTQPQPLLPPSPPQQFQTKSVPIKVNLKRDSTGSFDPAVIHRRCSAPCVYDSNASPAEDGTLNSNRSRPTDYVDPKDGHLWRAKYCILEDGILYFYRNAEDADSPDAKKERKNTDPLVDDSSRHRASAADSKDLSKSPMASRSLLHFPGADGSSASGSNSDAESSFMWEKRVALNCVGAVRSAETEFGANAFELLSVDDEEDEGYTNKLVLKALQQEEMNEWLFQFHRSLASFVRNVVDWVGATSPSYALGDIHHPSFQQEAVSHSIQTPLRSFNVPAFSPRFVSHMPSPSVAALSHGHGRSNRRRRNNNKGLSTQSVHSVPNTPLSESPTQFPFQIPSFSANLVTPLNTGDLVRPQEETQSTPAQPCPSLEQREETPELSAPRSSNPPETERPPAPAKTGKYVPPHMRAKKKYVPPHLREKDNGSPGFGGSTAAEPKKYLPPHLRNKNGGGSATGGGKTMPEQTPTISSSDPSVAAKSDNERSTQEGAVQIDTALKLGGCADPQVISGSILDKQFVPKKASRVGPVQTNAYGSEGGGGKALGGCDAPSQALKWEIGAVSECGIRDSNEDSYIIANDLSEAFKDIVSGTLSPTYWDGANHQSGLFAIFDGHCGNQAARYAAEKLPHFLYGESIESRDAGVMEPGTTEEIMRRAIMKLDEEFCRICVEDEREWESGSTALIAMLANEHLVIANIGDCRGVLCRLVAEGSDKHPSVSKEEEQWTELQPEHGGVSGQKSFWMEVGEVHSPSRKDEKERIEMAGGWTTTEKEIPISQLQRMDFLDADVRDILQRCFQINDGEGSKTCRSAPQRILEITRVCGELAVSRALGDRDFKAASNITAADEGDDKNDLWECQLFLPYPENHRRFFVGDLVSGHPDFRAIRVGETGIEGEFLLLACDGLWDVMDADDAVRVTRDLLFEKNYPAKQAAARLAELSIHLGSSDNITVIVIKFLGKGPAR